MKTSKENYTMVLNILQPNKMVEIRVIEVLTNLPNRVVRQAISDIAIDYPIISLPTEKGYMRIDATLENKDAIIEHQIADYNSRIKRLNERITQLEKLKREN